MEHYGEYLARTSHGEKLQRWMVKSTLKQFIKKAKLTPEETSILDIGAGLGRGARASAELNFKTYTGVEPSPKLAEYCRNQKIVIVENSLPNLDLIDDETFDAAYMLHVLEHAPNYFEARDWCKEALRTLRPGGVLLLASPNILDYKEYFWSCDWSHGYPTAPQRISQICLDLEHELVFSGSLHLGRVNVLSAAFAHVISFLLPTRICDRITMRLVGRPLASNLKIACLWGLSFVVLRKREVAKM